jgi:hypothetical protein
VEAFGQTPALCGATVPAAAAGQVDELEVFAH